MNRPHQKRIKIGTAFKEKRANSAFTESGDMFSPAQWGRFTYKHRSPEQRQNMPFLTHAIVFGSALNLPEEGRC